TQITVSPWPIRLKSVYAPLTSRIRPCCLHSSINLLAFMVPPHHEVGCPQPFRGRQPTQTEHPCWNGILESHRIIPKPCSITQSPLEGHGPQLISELLKMARQSVLALSGRQS